MKLTGEVLRARVWRIAVRSFWMTIAASLVEIRTDEPGAAIAAGLIVYLAFVYFRGL